MKTHRGVKVQVHHSWPRHYMEVSGQLHVPAALLPGKHAPVPSDRKIGGPQSRSGCRGVEKNISPRGNRIPAFQRVICRCIDWVTSTEASLQSRRAWLQKLLRPHMINPENWVHDPVRDKLRKDAFKNPERHLRDRRMTAGEIMYSEDNLQNIKSPISRHRFFWIPQNKLNPSDCGLLC
jgi:hypothetical protein